MNDLINAIWRLLSCFIPDRIKRKQFRARHIHIPHAEKSKYLSDHIKYNLGVYTYLGHGTTIRDEKRSVVGKFCSISHDVKIGLSNHPVKWLTTHTFCCSDLSTFGMEPDKSMDWQLEFNPLQPVYVGNDVWIGYGAIIMDGVNIGDGAIIGAGAVVTKDVPPYAIVGGVPAKIIKYRFTDEQIDDLLRFRWWDLPLPLIKTLPFDNIDACISILKKISPCNDARSEGGDYEQKHL